VTEKSKAVGFSEKMAAVEESMDSLSFADYSLNRIWCERAIYDMGFGRGIEAWKPSLPRGGVLAVSEITWRCPEPPSKIAQHPESEYPELGTAFEKIAVVERAGYDLLEYFVFPASCWIENYNSSTDQRSDARSERHAEESEALELVEMECGKAALYQ
jgi:hypothetical protein